jgi:hypothetical protein
VATVAERGLELGEALFNELRRDIVRKAGELVTQSIGIFQPSHVVSLEIVQRLTL